MKKKINSWLAVIVKSPKLFKLVKLVKLMKFAKPMVTVLSLVLSAGLYAIVYNPFVGIGLVVMIFIHDLGHVMAMNREGYPTKGPVFIPFLGAALYAPKGMNRRQEAVIGIAGPVIGSLGALLMIGGYFLLGYKWMLVLGYLGIFINLFNMIPVSPLDGGRVTQAVGKRFQYVGIAMLLGVSIMLKNPGMLLIWIIVLFDMRFIPQRIRFWMAVTVELAMIIMLCAGIGINDRVTFWAVSIDCIIGILYLSMIAGLLFRRTRVWEGKRYKLTFTGSDYNLDQDSGSDRPILEKRYRTGWLISWLVLTAGLLALIISLSGPMHTLTA